MQNGRGSLYFTMSMYEAICRKKQTPFVEKNTEHVQNICNGFPKHSVSRHFTQCHSNDPFGLTFWAIVNSNPIGKEAIKSEIKWKSIWIFELQSLHPYRMNIGFDLNCFISLLTYHFMEMLFICYAIHIYLCMWFCGPLITLNNVVMWSLNNPLFWIFYIFYFNSHIHHVA